VNRGWRVRSTSRALRPSRSLLVGVAAFLVAVVTATAGCGGQPSDDSSQQTTKVTPPVSSAPSTLRPSGLAPSTAPAATAPPTLPPTTAPPTTAAAVSTDSTDPSLAQCRAAADSAPAQPVESATPEFAARCWILAFDDGQDAALATMFTDPQVRSGVQAQDTEAWAALQLVDERVSEFEFSCEDSADGPGGTKWCWSPWPDDEFGPVQTALRLTVVQIGDPPFWAVQDGLLGP
jgi:hypothetical protein